MDAFWIGAIILGVAIFFMNFNIIFRKKEFPDTEIGHSKELRKKGIICAKEEEMKLWKKKNNKQGCEGDICSSCNESCPAKELIDKEKNK